MEHTFRATARFQACLTINIYACRNNSDCYITDPSMRKIATLRLTVTDPLKVDPPEDYKINVSFSFGSTEFHVVAKDEQTGLEIETDVTFIAS